MAFPGTYNIDYYKGDTFEFRVYPKDSNGNQFLINQYNQFRFTISNVRGDTPPPGVTKVTINGYAQISNDNQYILCAITPENGAQMVAGTIYYYDVEIGKISSPYDFVYTLLQGTVNVSEQVTLPAAIPNSPQNVTLNLTSSTTGSVTWTPPTGTAPVSFYNVYLVSPIPTKINPTPIPATSNSFSVVIPPELQILLPPGTPIIVGVTAENVSGESAPATVAGTIPLES
jgi:hypothetical protein